MEGSGEALDAQQKLQQLWQGAPISQIANGAEISQPVSIFTRKKKKQPDSIGAVCAPKNDTFKIQDYSKGGNEIEKPNTTTVQSQYLQIAQTQSLFN